MWVTTKCISFLICMLKKERKNHHKDSFGVILQFNEFKSNYRMIMLTLHSQPLALCDVCWPTQDITYVAKVCLQDCSTRSQSCCLVSEIATINIQPWGHLSAVRRSSMFCLWNLTSKVHRGRRFTGDIMEQRLLRQTGKTIFDDFKPHVCIS